MLVVGIDIQEEDTFLLKKNILRSLLGGRVGIENNDDVKSTLWFLIIVFIQF